MPPGVVKASRATSLPRARDLRPGWTQNGTPRATSARGDLRLLDEARRCPTMGTGLRIGAGATKPVIHYLTTSQGQSTVRGYLESRGKALALRGTRA